jgi:phospholipase/carboxylesterase
MSPALKYLLLGPPRPTKLVALFHGLGDNCTTLQPVAQRWFTALPSTAFLLLEAPDCDCFGRELLSGAWSGDWYREQRPRDAGESAEEHYTATISDRCTHVSTELDRHLTDLGLRNRQLVLAGFSQGSALAAYTGLRRQCLGVLALGGPCPPRLSLLPDNNTTRCCVVVGDRDPYAPHAELTAAFAKYTPQGPTDGVHVVPGMEHDVTEVSIAKGLDFLASLEA